jgi:hypothetical protein
MKKFLTQKINFVHAIIVMLTLTVGIGMVSAGYALPGQTSDLDAFIHVGGGDQYIESLRLGNCSQGAPSSNPCNPLPVTFDLRGDAGAASSFDTVNESRFNVLFSTNVLKETFISNNAQLAYDFFRASHNGIQTPVQSVNVYGDVQATSLSSTGSENNQDLCFNTTGRLVLCPPPPIENAACGSANGTPTSTAPTTNHCNPGSLSGMTETSNSFDWTCLGSNGGSNASCSAPKTLNGSCGSSDGETFSSSPSAGLCQSGSASTVNDNESSTPRYTWTCYGTNGGSADYCSANYQSPSVNGQCKSYDSYYSSGSYASSQPATNSSNGCNAGNYADKTDSSTEWKWSCNGTDGGTQDQCTAERSPAVNGQCRPYNSGPYASQPTNSSYGCNAGNYADKTDSSTEWKWSCNGTDGGTQDQCTAERSPAVNGQCKSYDSYYSSGSYASSSQPATNSSSGCNEGNYADKTDSSTEWKWSCNGTDGGTQDQCTAERPSECGPNNDTICQE